MGSTWGSVTIGKGGGRRKGWPTEKQKRAGGRCHKGKRKPQGDSLGHVVGFYLITRKGGEDQKESEKEAEGKIAQNSQKGFHLSFLPSITSTRYLTLGFVTNDRTPSQHGAHIARTVAHFPVSFSHTENSTEVLQSIRFSQRGQNITLPTEDFKESLSTLRLN